MCHRSAAWRDTVSIVGGLRGQSSAVPSAVLQICRVRTSTSVAVCNARIDSQDSTASKTPAEWDQYAKTYNERWSTLLTALEEFKDNNPAWTKFRCVLIGKDFTELSVLKTAFLDVTILLCQFHVLKYLREEIASSDYGCNMWGGNQLRDLMNLLVYAKTDKEYMRHFRYMLHDSEAGRSISEQ
ncbi:hypothetical protein PC111_g576 [Phytophthora cactorum]|nr:hypothetical protein PC111_g576 [Phytophthora cactorum]